ncbi:uncharacterized protein LOC120170388 [Hibiscus syriacus]|uniref:uncharacterized protein LOC120170388 n=1 Tax=Hibiscus syriacus TaxID=106335 RepID=UPI001923F381|nr:uncharacterized protein LOC120170388 [Hibiscus syriacus]
MLLYVAIVWPDILHFSIYKVSGWSIVDSGSAKLLAWDTCSDRFAILESTVPPRMTIIHKGSSSRKAKEAAAAVAAAQAAAAANSAFANVQVRILLDDGTSNILRRSIGTCSEPLPLVLQQFTLLSSGYGSSGSYDDGFSSQRSTAKAVPQNFQFFRLQEDRHQHYIVICTLRPQFRYLGDIAIAYATGAVLQKRQLFVATPTTIECVLVDTGVAPIDIETRKRKEEMKIKEAQARAVAAHGELALIFVNGPQTAKDKKITPRPPMLQYCRGICQGTMAQRKRAKWLFPFRQGTFDEAHAFCAYVNSFKAKVENGSEEQKCTLIASTQLASFAVITSSYGLKIVDDSVQYALSYTHAPSVPAFLSSPKQLNVLGDAIEEKKVNEIVVGGGGVTVAVTHFSTEQKRPVRPLIVVCDCACLVPKSSRHSLSVPRAYGDAVSAVKWAIRLAREHHDDLAQFLLGMGYATEALHLPGISKRLEFDLAMKSNDLKRALQCLLKMSNCRDIRQDNPGLDMKDILNLTAKKENLVESVQGIVKFA